MYDRDLYWRVVRFQRTAVENTFNILSTIQGHSDKILKKSLEQMPWLPQASKSTCMRLSDSYIDGSNNLHRIVIQGFDGVERLLAGPGRDRKKMLPGTPEKQPVAQTSPSRPIPTAGTKQPVRKKAGAAQKSAPKTSSSPPDDPEAKPRTRQSAAEKPEETQSAPGQTKSASRPSPTPDPAAKSSAAPATPTPSEPSETKTGRNSATLVGKPA